MSTPRTPQSYLFLLGRQPALGRAELESIYGASRLHPVGQSAVVLDMPQNDAEDTVNADDNGIAFKRLGGSIKAARVLEYVETNDWRRLESRLVRLIDTLAPTLPEGKIQLGISAYDMRLDTGQLLATGLTLKKALRKHGHPVRLVPNKELELNSASVIHNGLTEPGGIELVLVKDSGRVIIARTSDVQDIDSYTLRDRGRPKRDAKVGMLPPKLAQIIINLANPTPGGTILDPFCGTGVLLQEGLLMGYSAYGTDLEPRMIEYSQANLDWLLDQASWLALNIREHKSQHIRLEVQDATAFQPSDSENDISVIASETYLGRPFTDIPSAEILNQTITDCNVIIKKFLKAIWSQIPAGTRMCLAIPAWQVRPGQFRHLPLLGTQQSGSIDSLGELGYNRISFEHALTEGLMYYRTDQIVARELLVIVKI